MPTVQLSQRPFLVLGAACILHVILISAQVTTRAGIPVLQVVTFGAFAEVQRATMKTVRGVRGLFSGYVDLRSVQADNERLKRELQDLQIRWQEEHTLAQRTERLQQLLEMKQRTALDTVASEIIGSSADPEFRTATIDKGSSEGLKPDMAVISPTGVVGRVILSSTRASKVQLLIDRSAAAAALIERTRAQGLVMGQGTDILRMEYVPGTADVKPGDLVVTSGIDAIYPKGFVIGTVEVAERGPGTFHNIIVRPAADFSRLEEVLVVTTPPAVKAAEAEEAAIVARQNAPPPQTPPQAANQSPRRPATNQSPRQAAPGNQSPREAPAIQPPRPRPSNQTAPQPPAPPPAVPQRPGNQTPGNQSPRLAAPQGAGA